MTPFAGYTLATIAVNKVHMTFGQRGIAIIAPICHLIPFLSMAVHPPFPVMLVAYAFVGFGNGLIDAAWNAWIGDMANANTLMGLLHSFYGLGYVARVCARRELLLTTTPIRATVSPTIATGMIKAGLHWWLFYYTLVGGAALELVGSVSLFWREDATQFRLNNPKTPGSAQGTRTAEAAKSRIVWVIALFLFAYMGVEGTLSNKP